MRYIERLLVIICSVYILYYLYNNSLEKRSIKSEYQNKIYPKSAEKNEGKKVLILREMIKYLSHRNESREAIFYTETSGKGTIKARFVCAIESAARTNPDSDIYLLMLVPPYVLNLTENVALDFVLKDNTNIHVLGCDLRLLLEDTILEDFYDSGKLETSKYYAEHTSDLIRFFVLWKYGGKYFDLDVILIKNMTEINNFVTEENPGGNTLCSGIIAYEKNSSIGLELITNYESGFNNVEWNANGPLLVTKVLINHCGVPVRNMTYDNCKGVHILRHEQFFPLQWFHLDVYFNEELGIALMKMIDSKIKDMYGIHIGNNICKDKVVRINSNQAYGLLAQRYCPRSYWSCDKYF